MIAIELFGKHCRQTVHCYIRIPLLGAFIFAGMAAAKLERVSAQDIYEPNDSFDTATGLGSVPFVAVDNLSIHIPLDTDYFRVTAPFSGLMTVRIYLVSASGNLDFFVWNSSGTDQLAAAATNNDVDDDSLPVVGGEVYFIQVLGAAGSTNTYDLQAQFTPAPVPAIPDLATHDDSGVSDHDNVTFRTTQLQFFFDVDLNPFLQWSIPILTPLEATIGNDDGVAVKVFVTQELTNDTTTVFASSVAGSTHLFTANVDFNPANGEVFLIRAAVQVFDGVIGAPTNGSNEMSQPLIVTSDNTAPLAPTSFQLVPASDSGSVNNDLVTRVREPTFVGVAEIRTRVVVRSDGFVVGEGVTGDDATDGVLGNGGGVFSVSVGQLADGKHNITATAEDNAGNIGAPTAALTIEVDSTPPNTPFLDLLAADDSGLSNSDNVTSVSTPHVNAFIEDPAPAGGHLLVDNVKFRIFDRSGNSPEILIVDSGALIANGVTTSQLFGNGVNSPLSDGLHGLKLVAEDRAGNLSQPFLLEILVDTAGPATPTILLLDGSDSSPTGDGITNVSEPAFGGSGESGTTAQLLIGGVLGGTSQVTSDGQWTVKSSGLAAGSHAFTVRLEDLAGNLSGETSAINLTIEAAADGTTPTPPPEEPDEEVPTEFDGLIFFPFFCGSTSMAMFPMTILGLIGIRRRMRAGAR